MPGKAYSLIGLEAGQPTPNKEKEMDGLEFMQQARRLAVSKTSQPVLSKEIC
jgi:hypothetical protein